MIKKVFILNEGSSNNLGDQFIHKSIQDYFIHKNFQISCADLTKKNKQPFIYKFPSGKISSFKFLINYASKLIWFFKHIKRILYFSNQKYDIIIIGGGQLLLDNKTFPWALFCWSSFLSIKNSSKIILFGVGYGGNFKGVEMLLIKFVLYFTSEIYTRDLFSFNSIKQISHTKVFQTHDLAFLFKGLSKEFSGYTYDYILSITSFDVYLHYNDEIELSEYYNLWLKHIDWNANIALAYSTPEDRLECVKFVSYCESKFGIKFDLLESCDISSLISNLNSGNYVVSGRMHVLIISLMLKKDVIPINVSQKLISFHEELSAYSDVHCVEKVIDKQLNQLISKTLL